MPLAIKLSFNTHLNYPSMAELFQAINLRAELDMHGISSQLSQQRPPRLDISTRGRKGAIFLMHGDGARAYSLVFPDNKLVYSVVFAALKARNLKTEGEIVSVSELRLKQEDEALLSAF
ncbi:MAG: hypothetical protein ABH829_02265 [archaeon]